MSLSKKILILAAPVALLALSGCATGLPTQVSRFQALPVPAGQTFIIQPNDREQGGLEFATYAEIVRRHLLAQGYADAASPRDASLIVTLDYGVDNGRERIYSTPGFGYGGWGGFGRLGGFGRYGGYYGRYHNPYYWGWGDPFWGGETIESYTVYTSHLDMNIRRAADGQSLFEGHAQARSRSNELPALVPNLVEAMFTGFPGNSGETMRITIMPERRASN